MSEATLLATSEYTTGLIALCYGDFWRASAKPEIARDHWIGVVVLVRVIHGVFFREEVQET
jgi:hypothetical protein